VCDEGRAAAGYVHGRLRLLEAGAVRVGSERVLDVPATAALVQQCQGDALAERPRQQVVVVALCRQMGSILIVDTQTRADRVTMRLSNVKS